MTTGASQLSTIAKADDDARPGDPPALAQAPDQGHGDQAAEGGEDRGDRGRARHVGQPGADALGREPDIDRTLVRPDPDRHPGDGEDQRDARRNRGTSEQGSSPRRLQGPAQRRRAPEREGGQQADLQREAREAEGPLAAAEILRAVDLLRAEIALLGDVNGLGSVIAWAQCPDGPGGDRQRCKGDTGDAYSARAHSYLR